VIEVNIKRGFQTETYSLSDGRVFIRLLASNRELTGSALIKYVREKCIFQTLSTPNNPTI